MKIVLIVIATLLVVWWICRKLDVSLAGIFFDVIGDVLGSIIEILIGL